MDKDLFMRTLKKWREENPNPYTEKVIEKWVIDSFAFEGDHVHKENGIWIRTN